MKCDYQSKELSPVIMMITEHQKINQVYTLYQQLFACQAFSEFASKIKHIYVLDEFLNDYFETLILKISLISSSTTQILTNSIAGNSCAPPFKAFRIISAASAGGNLNTPVPIAGMAKDLMPEA